MDAEQIRQMEAAREEMYRRQGVTPPDRRMVEDDFSLPERDLPEEYYVAQQMQDDGCDIAQLIQHFGKSRSTIFRWLHAVKDEGAQRIEASANMVLLSELLHDCHSVESRVRQKMKSAESDENVLRYAAELRHLLKFKASLLLELGICKG